MENRTRPLASTLRAFLAQCRSNCVDPNSWQDLADQFLLQWESQPIHIVSTTASTLWKERSSVPENRFTFFIDQVKKCLARKDITPELTSILKRLLPNSHFDKHQPSSNNKRIANTDNDKDWDDVVAVPRKRSRTVTPNISVDNSDNNAISDDDVHVVKQNDSAHSQTLLYGFHLLKTFSVPCSGDNQIELTDILVAGAELAVIFNFQFDMYWLIQNAPALQTYQKIFIVHGMSLEHESTWLREFEQYDMTSRVRLIRPKTLAFGTVHSKMFLLFYPTGCRVCIHTANMVPGDWNMKTQGAYLRDFPLRSIDDIDKIGVECDFEQTLSEYVLRSMSTPDSTQVVSRLARHDFSSAGVALVSSTPGKHVGDDIFKFGHMRLRKLLSKEIFDHNARESAVICQFSSLGSTRADWISEEFGKSVFTQLGADNDDRGELQFVYPTVSQVEASIEGIEAGSSIPVSSKNLQREHVLSRLYTWDARISGRQRAMPHIKTFVRYSCSNPKNPAWVFLGSFNLSVAAWGRTIGHQTPAKRRETNFGVHILSFEIGVLFTRQLATLPVFAIPDACVKYPVATEEECIAWKAQQKQNALVLKFQSACESNTDISLDPRQQKPGPVILPIPYVIPPQRYTKDDVPWTIDRCHIM